MKHYRRDLDLIKGVAIIGVVLFHMGLVKSGYLGVDAFFIINGFLLVPSLCKSITNNNFSFLTFLIKRVLRLLPLILLASFVCLLFGFWIMLPDDYENLSQSVIASNLFSQNILSSITVSDYWNAVNDYKPLMHLWYVGILMEFYLIIPIILYFSKYIADLLKKDRTWTIIAVLSVLTLLSLGLYLSPYVTDGNKFYMLPCRFFELSSGGLLCILKYKLGKENLTSKKFTQYISLLGLIFCTFIIFSSLARIDTGVLGTFTPVVGDDTIYDDGMIAPRQILLIFTVLSTILVCLFVNGNIKLRALEYIGKRSYSIFIWHQILLAFYRYCISDEITFNVAIFILVIVAVMSEVTYRFVEQKINASMLNAILFCSLSLIVIIGAYIIYNNAGVVRDVPELNIKKGEGKKGMFSDYCDRIYQFDKSFDNNGKINILVSGVSYGRDFCNVLLESPLKDSINISYISNVESLNNYADRLKEADYFFVFSSKHDVPKDVWTLINKDAIVYGIGSKAYGTNNGIVYFNRNTPGYYLSTAKVIPGLLELNEKWKKEWGEDRYINFVDPVLVKKGGSYSVKVFTPDNKFISQDCRHLTPAGAKWYAEVLEIDSIINYKGL